MMDLFVGFCCFLVLLFIAGIVIYNYTRPENEQRRNIERMAKRDAENFLARQTGIVNRSRREQWVNYTPLYNKKGYDYCNSHTRTRKPTR